MDRAHAAEPRRRDAAATRTRILEAAQRAFSETGYSHTGIREIAAMAGTSSTLLLRYFGSKAGLYEAALREAIAVEGTMAFPRETFAEHLAAALLDPENVIRPPLMIALAAGDPEAAAIAAAVFEERSIGPVAAWLASADGRARAVELAMLATGMVFYLRQLPMTSLLPEELEHITGWFIASVRAIVEG